MARKNANMLHNVDGNTQATLQAKTGESIMVKSVKIFNPATNYATLSIEKTTVGFFRVGGVLGNHLNYPSGGILNALNLLDYLFLNEIFKGYPVAEGETFKIDNVHQAGSRVTIIYDLYDAGDIVSTEENGSRATDYFYMNYGNLGGAITTAGEKLLTTTLNPSEFTSFPFDDDVPAKQSIQLFGITASEHGCGAAGPTDNLGSTYLKFVKERTVLFDEEKNGIILYKDASALVADAIGGGQSLIGNNSDTDPRRLYMLDEPMTFQSGEELNIYIAYDGLVGTPSIGIDQQEIGLILKSGRE